MEKNRNQNSSKALRALKVTIIFQNLFKNFLLVIADYRINPVPGLILKVE